jgi:hypothetical protein
LTLERKVKSPAVQTTAQFALSYGNVMEIADIFGGPEKLRFAVTQLQTLLYAA